MNMRLHNALVPLRTWLAKKGLFLSGNDRRLWGLKDCHKGKKAVVIGMGPSLKPEDLPRFEGFVGFACNKIFLAYEDTSWRPDYYSALDSLVIENNREKIAALAGSTKIFPAVERKHLPAMGDAIFFPTFVGFRNPELQRHPLYSENPIEGVVGGGGSVLLPMIQMAYWMGCDPVYLVGVDFNFQVSKSTKEKSRLGEKVLEGEGEVNHFHPDYRPRGEKWTMPKMEEQQEAFTFAVAAFRNAGRQLLNASRVSKLEDVERVNFDDVF